jgi:hypothetical protein
MIFAISSGSDGSGHGRYAAYLPFVLAPGANLQPIEGPVEINQGSLSLRLEKLRHLYAVGPGRFPLSVRQPQIWMSYTHRSLWISSRFGVGVSYSRTRGELKLFEEPKPSPDSGPFADVAGVKGWAAQAHEH